MSATPSNLPDPTATPHHGAVALVVIAQWLGTSLWFSPSGAAAGLMAQLGIGPAAFGWLISATQLGFIAGTVGVSVSGAADRFAASRVFASSSVVGAVANALTVVPGLGFDAVWALRFVVGICLAGIYPLGMKMIVQWVGGRPAAAFGWLVGMLALGTAMPHGLRAVGAAWPWQAVLSASSALALVGAVMVWWLGDGPHGVKPSAGAVRHGSGALGPVGTTGPTAATGTSAAIGTTGATGMTATTGTTGMTGMTATTGTTATIGTTGMTATTATTATTGATGATVTSATSATSGAASAIRQIFRVPGFRASAFGYFGHMWELYAFWSVLPLLCQPLVASWAQRAGEGTGEGAGASTGDGGAGSVAALSFAVIAVGAVGCILGGLLSRRIGSAWVAAAALAGSGLMCLVYPLIPAQAVGLHIAALFFWGFCVVADSPQFSALSAQQAPPRLLGSALVTQNGIGFGITVVSILILSRAVPAWGASAMWLLAPGPLIGLWAMRSLLRGKSPGRAA